MNNDNLKVGQTVWLKPFSNYTRKNTNPVEVIISKVGKKYIYIKGSGYNDRFFIDNLMHDNGEYSPKGKIYLTYQEILDENEFMDKWFNLRDYFSNYNTKCNMKLRLNKLREVHSIIFDCEDVEDAKLNN